MMSTSKQTSDKHKGLKLVDSQKLTQDSPEFFKKSPHSPQNLKTSTWAKQFITQHHITKDTFSKIPQFAELSKPKKQAIYYQLRKGRVGTPKAGHTVAFKPKTRPNLNKRPAHTPMGLDLATLSMLAVISGEIILLSFAYHFYLEIGFSFMMAILAALSIEVFYIITSGATKTGLRLLKYPIYAYTIFTACYSLYINDPKLMAYNTQYESQINLLKSQAEQQKQISTSLHGQLNSALADMSVFRERGLVSRGRAAVAEEKRQLQTKIEDSESKTQKIQSQIMALEAKAGLAHSTSVFSFEKVRLIEVRTWSIIGFLALMQLLSSVFINEFAKSVRAYFQGRKKIKRIAIKDVFWQPLTNA